MTRSDHAIAGIVAGILCAALCSGAAAQPERWSRLEDTAFHHLGVDQGLPHDVVTAVAQDGDGFLWAGTEGGLARWDGYRFRRYVPAPGVPGALPDNFILCLHTDPKGVLWIGMAAGGLARYDPALDRFDIISAEQDRLNTSSVHALADDGAGGLWVGTDNGLDHLDPVTGKLSRSSQEGADNAALLDRQVRALLLDSGGALWVGTAGGLARRERNGVFHVVPLPGNAQISVWTLFQDSASRIWIGTQAQGAFVIDGDVHTVPGASIRGDRGNELNGEWVYTIAEGKPGEVWLGTYGHGIVAIDGKTGEMRHIVHEPAEPASLGHNGVWTLFRDRAGIMWVGTFGSLDRISLDLPGVSTLFGWANRANGLSDSDVSAVVSGEDGRVWLGYSNNGIAAIDPISGHIETIGPTSGDPRHGLARSWVRTLATSGGEIWVGMRHGLYRVSARNIERVVVTASNPEMGVESLLDRSDGLWVGAYQDGLWQLVDGKVAAHYAASRLGGGSVISLKSADGGRLWVGTTNGLNLIDPATGEIERISADLHDPQALASAFISSLLVDRQGRLWVGTLGGGISVMQGRDNGGRLRFRRIDRTRGLASDNIGMLVMDDDGRIWASTADGLAIIDPGTLAVVSLHSADGVAIRNYWTGSGAVTSAGEVLFGGLGGLTVVRPNRIAAWSYHPPIVVTDLQVNGKAEPFGQFNEPTNTPPLLIPPGRNTLAVEFAALDYTDPARNLYSYRLDGFDQDWVATDWTRRVAAYTNLPPGNYTLHIRGSNRNGLWSEKVLAIPIRILPAWWQTGWFRLLTAFMAFMAIVGIVKIRTTQLRTRQVVLERRVAERTAELEQRTGELQEAKQELEQIAYVDALTALANRRMFTEFFQKRMALSNRHGRRFALLLIDLDRFKQINDTLGHDAGDALLVEAALRFKSCIREADFVARLGGDEFAILLDETGEPDDIDDVCLRIVDCFVEPVPFKGQFMKSSPSIGVALYPEHGASHEDLFKSADIALYAAKRAGRNTWRWHGADEGSDTTTAAELRRP